MTQEFKNLHSQILVHPGKRILDGLKAYQFSKDIFARNALDLRTLTIQLEDISDPLKIDDIAHRQRLQSLFSEVTRLLHNFATGGSTLIDHTRNLMKEDFISEVHRSEYNAHVDQTFAHHPLAKFLKDFRNYVAHYAVPNITLTIQFQPHIKTLHLDIAPMLTWHGWGPHARSFMTAHAPSLRVLDLVNQYEDMVKSSYDIQMRSFLTHYAKQINEVRALIQQWNQGLL